MLIPQVVIALGLFLFFEPAGMLGSPLAIALGHTVLAAPIAVLIMISTLRGIDERLEDAAASMGASRMTIARRITFPLATPGLIAAAVFSFITSFDEFFIAQFLSTPDTRTLPVLVFNALQFDVDPTVTGRRAAELTGRAPPPPVPGPSFHHRQSGLRREGATVGIDEFLEYKRASGRPRLRKIVDKRRGYRNPVHRIARKSSSTPRL
ncbi:ABC transporter permease subunit [Streptomyces sp. Go-475]|uniref:ABC transporter permease n=1 Tax=Streptomyces sp. Go-475 TaxID=2072505 RepID=UPI000DF0759F|nr:ABC transporter permease subunit [Streptomyces sp. Go-475]AXE83675.1 Inner membrane ABC transporter permease protein YcjP [Streptomyces sp. Go-475]